MMTPRKMLLASVTMFSLLLAATIHAGAARVPTATTRAATTGIRFAVVDMARVLRDWEAVKDLAPRQWHEYQEEPGADQRKLERLNAMLLATKDEDEKRKIEKTRRTLITAMQTKFQREKDELSRKEKASFDDLKSRIHRAIDKLAAERNLEMVIEKQWMYYPRTTLDVTDELLFLLRKESSRSVQQKSSHDGR